MHNNDIISKLEYLLVKYHASNATCESVHRLVDRTCWPIKYNPDYRYLAIAMCVQMLYIDLITQDELREELGVYTLGEKILDHANNVLNCIYALFAASKVDAELHLEDVKPLNKYSEAVFTAFTEILIERYCKEHQVHRIKNIIMVYDYVLENYTEKEKQK